MIKDCMKKVITVNLHQTVKVGSCKKKIHKNEKFITVNSELENFSGLQKNKNQLPQQLLTQCSDILVSNELMRANLPP